MHRVALFVEDNAHQVVIGTLVQRLANEVDVSVRLDWRSTRRGHGKVVSEFRQYLADLSRQRDALPDLLVVATDANCKGLRARTKEFEVEEAPAPVILAIPDPHIERWLLLDGAAFKDVLGRGCEKPDLKCSRDRYKERLLNEIHAAGVVPSLGGIEFGEDLVKAMNIDRACNEDRALDRFVTEIRQHFTRA